MTNEDKLLTVLKHEEERILHDIMRSELRLKKIRSIVYTN